MEIEYPPLLTGKNEEQISQIREYLCRLADTLRAQPNPSDILESDGGNGIELKGQFESLSNKIRELKNEIRELKEENNG